MTNLYSILKSRDITFPTKVHLFKAMVFPVVMYGCESWTVKKAEHWKIDAFELWCCRKLLRVPWLRGDPTSPSRRRSVLGVHWRDSCWSWNSNTWPPVAKSWLIGKDPDAGRDWRQEEEGTTEDEMAGWHHWLYGHEFGWTLELVMDREAWCLRFTGSQSIWRKQSDTTQRLNWTELNWGYSPWGRLLLVCQLV